MRVKTARATKPAKPPVTASGYGVYFIAGLACLFCSGIAGLITLGLLMEPRVPAHFVWFLGPLLLFAGSALLLASVRAPVWAKAGAVGAYPPPPEQASPHWFYQPRVQVLALVLVACIPRLIALKQSLWYDELWTLDFMRSTPLDALTHQSLYNNHLLNSLLGELCWGFYHLATGHPRFLAPGWVVRFPALIFGIASVAMLYVLAKAVFPVFLAMLLSLLLALSPVAVDISAQARGYAGMLFFTLCQTYFLLRILRTGQDRDWLAWLLCAVLLVSCHLYGVCVVGVDLLLFATVIIRTALRLAERERARALLEQVTLFCAAWAALSVASYAGILYALRETARSTTGMAPVSHAHALVIPTLQYWAGAPVGLWLALYSIVGVTLVLCGVRYLLRHTPGIAAYLGMILLVPPVLVELAQPHFVTARFFVFALPAFLTLIACGSVEVGAFVLRFARGPERVRVLAPALGALAFLLLTLPGLWQVLAHPKQDYAGAASALRDLVKQGSIVACVPSGTEYFRLYGVNLLPVNSVKEVSHLVEKKKPVYVVDTQMSFRPDDPPMAVAGFVREKGVPFTVLRGRFPRWPYRWLDGDTDITLYRMDSSPELSGNAK